MQLPDEVIKFGIETLDAMQADSQESIAEKQMKRQLSDLVQKIGVVESNLAEERSSDARTIIMRKLNELRIQRQSVEQDISKAQYERENKHVEIRNSLDLIHHAKHTFNYGTGDQRRAILRGLGSNWLLTQQMLVYKPSFVAIALKKTRELHLADITMLELAKMQSQIAISIHPSLVTMIWSGWRESNPLHQVGNLR